MISISLATENDIIRILEIEWEAISPPWTHGALLNEIYREDSFFALAVTSETGFAERSVTGMAGTQSGEQKSYAIHGFVILRCLADEGELLQIAVDKAFRRRGVADALMDATLLYASENLLKPVFLEVRKSNEAAIMLYKKHGFKSVRLRKNYYSNPFEDALVMAFSMGHTSEIQ